MASYLELLNDAVPLPRELLAIAAEYAGSREVDELIGAILLPSGLYEGDIRALFEKLPCASLVAQLGAYPGELLWIDVVVVLRYHPEFVAWPGPPWVVGARTPEGRACVRSLMERKLQKPPTEYISSWPHPYMLSVDE